MSWLYSRVLVAEYSAAYSSDGAQSAPLNSTDTPRAYLSHGKTTDASRLSRYGMMCEPLTESHGEALLMSYLADSRVRTFHVPERALESKANGADYGSRQSAPL